MSLSEKSCIPCQGNTPPLTKIEAEALLKQLGRNWEIQDSGHLYKEYKFSNFMKSMDFSNKIACLAEKEGHHPDLRISWGKCGVEIWTHKINGLSESDFYLASKIDDILA